jgi:hypothetical protein
MPKLLRMALQARLREQRIDSVRPWHRWAAQRVRPSRHVVRRRWYKVWRNGYQERRYFRLVCRG